MAVYYKFKSEKDYDRMPIEGHSVSVSRLKEKIIEAKHLDWGKDFALVITHAQTNQDYLGESAVIPKNTTVIVRRVPGPPRMPIVTQQDEQNAEASKPDNAQLTKNKFAGSSIVKNPDDSEWDDEFGGDLYAIPEKEKLPIQISNPLQDAPPLSKADEDSKIRALVDTPVLDWQRQDGFGPCRGYGRGMRGRMMHGRGRGGYVRKTPPPDYVCNRCKQTGHYIQQCPTNGDPKFDIMKVRHRAIIPKTNEAEFDKVVKGLPSNRPVANLPPSLHCPLCNKVMKDAVLTSTCCFSSFCDTCIRDHIINNSKCVCDAPILADHLIPNKTVRETIQRTLEINDNSTENVAIVCQVQDFPEAAKDPLLVKENASQRGPLLAVEDVQQKQATNVTGKKKKKKKAKVSSNEMQWENPQDFSMGKDMMPMGAAAYDPYWNPMQPGMEGFVPHFGAPMPPYMGYGAGPMEVPFGLVPRYPFGSPSMMMPQPPFPPQRDLALETGMNVEPPPIMSREEFEAQKADIRRKREMERGGGRNLARDREFNSKMSSNDDVSSQRPKSLPKPLPPPSIRDHSCRHQCSNQPSPPQEHLRHCSTSQSPPPARLPYSKRQSSDYDHHHKDSHHHHQHYKSNLSSKSLALEAPLVKSSASSAAKEVDHKQKSSAFSRINYQADEQTTKRNKNNSPEVAPHAGSSGSKHKKRHHGDHKNELEVRKVVMEVDSGSSEDDEDKHFKRRRRHSRR